MIQAEHDEAYRVLSKCSSQTVSSSPRPSGMLPSSGVLPSVGRLDPVIVSDQTPELNTHTCPMLASDTRSRVWLQRLPDYEFPTGRRSGWKTRHGAPVRSVDRVLALTTPINAQ